MIDTVGDSSTPAKQPNSTGSPSDVPVPWASIHRVSSSPVRRSRCYCDDPFGAVNVALYPLCRQLDPRCVSSTSGPMDVFIMPTHPSPRWYPFARKSNVWHRPCVESIPAIVNITNVPHGLRIMLVPIDRESIHSLRSIKCTAKCVATRLDEQAVSVVMQGPRIENAKDNHDPANETPLPIISYGPGIGDIFCA